MSSRGSQRQGQGPLPVEREFRQRLRRAMVSEATVLLAVVSVLLVLVVFLQNLNRWVDHAYVVIGRVGHVQRLIIDAESQLRAYLITGDQTHLAAYDDAEDRVLPAIDGLDELVIDNPAQVARLASARGAAAKWRNYAEEQLARKRAGAALSTLALHLPEGIPVAAEARHHLDDFLKVEKGLRTRRIARVNAVMHYILFTGAGFVLLLGPALLLTTARQMRRVREAYHEALEARERATTSLQESEEKLQLAKDAARMGAWNWDLCSGELVWSERCKALFGLGPDTVMSKEVFLAAVHPDDRGRVDRALQDAMANGTPYDVEMRVPLPDGTIRWVASKGQAMRGAEGRPLRLAGMVMDITKPKESEEALRRSEDQARMRAAELEAVLNCVADGVIVYDREGHTTRSTPAAEVILSVPLSERQAPIQDRVARQYEVTTEDGRLLKAEEMAAVRAAVRGETVRGEVQRIRTGRNEPRWVRINAGPLVVSGKHTGAVLSMTDITDRKRAETALREGEKRFRALVLASSDVVYRMSADWSEMLHLTGRNFISDSLAPTTTWLEKYIHPDDQPSVKAAINAAIQAKSVYELEHRILRVDGTLGWTFSRAIPMLDSGGSIIEWFGMASDVTARKTAELALEKANALLRETDRRKDEFLGVLSHELRNPLAPIRSSVHILGRADPSGDQAMRARTIIARQVDHLARLVDDLLDVTRITSGKIRLQRRRLDLNDLAHSMVDD
ncbi:MAG TPA: PAS domain-containing protein, partial [Anaeromyxobacteraceae bacterium]|nr:PAS domain-containing protein [Anaeromyxobacteraceae bacterium]